MVEVIEMAIKVNGLEEIKADTKEVSLIGAVNYIHEKKILHRDNKPENWLVQYSSFDVNVSLGDLGLAHVGTEATGFYGTSGYMAPKSLRRKGCIPVRLKTGASVVFYMR